jgi:hypothetical protein
MDVEALVRVAAAVPQASRATRDEGHRAIGLPGGSAAAATSVPTPQAKTASERDGSGSALDPALHVAFEYMQNPPQVVVVFSETNGQEIAQVPPQSLVELVKFDHAAGELVDRNV